MGDWTAELTLNHEILDGQHAEIFRRLAAVAEVLEGTRAWTVSLRSGPMYVSVRAPTRDLALGAAQQLRPMP